MEVFSKHAKIIPKDGARPLNFPEGFGFSDERRTHKMLIFFSKLQFLNNNIYNYTKKTFGLWQFGKTGVLKNFIIFKLVVRIRSMRTNGAEISVTKNGGDL